MRSWYELNLYLRGQHKWEEVFYRIILSAMAANKTSIRVKNCRNRRFEVRIILQRFY